MNDYRVTIRIWNHMMKIWPVVAPLVPLPWPLVELSPPLNLHDSDCVPMWSMLLSSPMKKENSTIIQTDKFFKRVHKKHKICQTRVLTWRCRCSSRFGQQRDSTTPALITRRRRRSIPKFENFEGVFNLCHNKCLSFFSN